MKMIANPEAESEKNAFGVIHLVCSQNFPKKLTFLTSIISKCTCAITG